MIQDIIVYTVGGVIAAGLCYRLYRRLITIRKGEINKCAGCTGCDLKNPSDF